MKNLFFLWLLSFTLTSHAYKVGLVLDKGGKDDKSFNAAGFRGATEGKEKLGIELKVLESSSDNSLEPNHRQLAQRGYDLIIGVGFVHQEPIARVAKQFPKTKFVLIDAVVDLPNVRSVMFQEHEGSYLVGAIAAMSSKTGTVGFVGGMEIPLIKRFYLGYEAGAKAINPKIKVIEKYVGSSSDAWRNPSKAKELALSEINSKADVIFTPSGASGLGVFDAIEEKKVFAIGCDSNQNWVKPGKILTSMLKRVDTAVYEAIADGKNEKFTAGKKVMGVKEGGVDFAVDSFNQSVLKSEVIAKANQLKTDIAAGKIQVPDYYVLQKK